MRWTIPLVIAAACSSGCSILPEIAHEPTLHNPFPQLSKVAVAPFFNHTTDPTVDGRQFALAYFNELQSVPGYEVIPVGTVESAMLSEGITLAGPEEARRLAQVLGADAVVIGALTDFSPYYPPRCALQVEWYAANPCFHPIPPGYGLPWGTAEEDEIPGRLIFETELAVARQQLATQTPAAPVSAAPGADGASATTVTAGREPAASWPDPRGLIPAPPSPVPPECRPSGEPVLRHTKTYNGHDPEFTEALANYYFFRDDARFGGWQSYLQRSDDFIRFCCRMHIWEMLGARGGAGETRVVWRWPMIR
jgi:hypothetical protein